MAGEDFGNKPGGAEKAKSKHSPLDKVFNKGLREDEKWKGLLKMLKIIEDRNKGQLLTRQFNINNEQEKNF